MNKILFLILTFQPLYSFCMTPLEYAEDLHRQYKESYPEYLESRYIYDIQKKFTHYILDIEGFVEKAKTELAKIEMKNHEIRESFNILYSDFSRSDIEKYSLLSLLHLEFSRNLELTNYYDKLIDGIYLKTINYCSNENLEKLSLRFNPRNIYELPQWELPQGEGAPRVKLGLQIYPSIQTGFALYDVVKNDEGYASFVLSMVDLTESSYASSEQANTSRNVGYAGTMAALAVTGNPAVAAMAGRVAELATAVLTTPIYSSKVFDEMIKQYKKALKRYEELNKFIVDAHLKLKEKALYGDTNNISDGILSKKCKETIGVVGKKGTSLYDYYLMSLKEMYARKRVNLTLSLKEMQSILAEMKEHLSDQVVNDINFIASRKEELYEAFSDSLKYFLDMAIDQDRKETNYYLNMIALPYQKIQSHKIVGSQINAIDDLWTKIIFGRMIFFKVTRSPSPTWEAREKIYFEKIKDL